MARAEPAKTRASPDPVGDNDAVSRSRLPARIVGSMRIDFTPLRTYRGYRLLFIGQGVSFVGSMVTYVALPYQAYVLSHSSLIVGLISLCELVPILRCGAPIPTKSLDEQDAGREAARMDIHRRHVCGAQLERGASVTVQARGSERPALYAARFADVPAGELVLLEDSARALALAVNLGSAAELLGLSGLGDELVLRRA